MKQTDEKGLVSELVVSLRNENSKLADDLSGTQKGFVEKSEKITWFERKLNKWIKLFEAAESESGSRHNGLVSKIGEIEGKLRLEVSKIKELTKGGNVKNSGGAARGRGRGRGGR